MFYRIILRYVCHKGVYLKNIIDGVEYQNVSFTNMLLFIIVFSNGLFPGQTSTFDK